MKAEYKKKAILQQLGWTYDNRNNAQLFDLIITHAMELYAEAKVKEALSIQDARVKELEKKLFSTHQQATRINRASDLKRFLVTDLEIIAKLSNEQPKQDDKSCKSCKYQHADEESEWCSDCCLFWEYEKSNNWQSK